MYPSYTLMNGRPRSLSVVDALLLFLSIVVSLGLAEITVRLFVPVRDVGPSFTRYDPIYGKRLKANFSGERITPEFRMRLSTNSLSFRGPEPAGIPERSILFLGDSFTLGYGVSDGEEYPARIAAELTRRDGKGATSVINAGIGDSGNGFWLKFLHNEAGKFRPHIVVMQLFENDFEDNIHENMFALAADGSLQELAIRPPDTMRKLQTLIESVPGLSQTYLVGLLRATRIPNFADHAGANEQTAVADELTFHILEQAIAMCEDKGWSTVGLAVGLSPSHLVGVQRVFARHGSAVVIVPSKADRPDLYYKIDGHWRSTGHAFVADRLIEALRGAAN
jgi:lysophospholipase L1-like esterase